MFNKSMVKWTFCIKTITILTYRHDILHADNYGGPTQYCEVSIKYMQNFFKNYEKTAYQFNETIDPKKNRKVS